MEPDPLTAETQEIKPSLRAWILAASLAALPSLTPGCAIPEGQLLGKAEVVSSPADPCAAGACGDFGQCVPVPLPSGATGCEAGADSDCAASKICKTHGWCAATTASTGFRVCKPTLDAHCAQAAVCADPALEHCKVWGVQCARVEDANKACAKLCQETYPGKSCSLADGKCLPKN